MVQTGSDGLPPNAPYVNALLLQTMHGIEAVLGQKGLEAALRGAGMAQYVAAPPPNDLELEPLAREYAQLNEAVAELTGRAAQATLQRIGRAVFRWEVEEQAATLGFATLALKVLPLRWRQRAVLRAMRQGVLDLVPYARVEVGVEGDALVYTDYTCPICHLRQAPRPVCHLTAGMLAEAMVFATGREAGTVVVVETHCKAQGDECCRFEIRDRM